MLYYPDINPVAFTIGPLPVRWYGLMYLFSFLIAWLLMRYRAAKLTPPLQSEQVSDLLFYIVLGVVLGGRIGYVIFYGMSYYLHHPFNIITTWRGGMSFHGGLIGVIIACLWWSYRHRYRVLTVTDVIAPLVPIGLGAGRIGNFINGELWGRITTMPWGMVYPQAGWLPRHPSQLYECFFEGVLLLIILWYYDRKPRPVGAMSGLFLLLYGCFRFFCEFFRQPDPQLGFVAWGWMTRGQQLSLPMIVGGIILLTIAYWQNKT